MNTKEIFEKIKHNHYVMIFICIMPILILSVGSYVFGWESNNLLIFAFLAACMFGHLFMMHNHKEH